MEISIPMHKTVSMRVANGEMKIRKIKHSIGGEQVEAYELEYHNPIYVGSPFKLSTTFSTQFSTDEIMKSSEVCSFMGRFDS